jgi:hypothetical protein
MAQELIVKVDLSQLGLDTLRLTPSVRNKVLKVLAERSIAEIKMLTSAGLDADGAPFIPYTDGYTTWKAQQGKGRSPMSEGDWLNFTGQLLKSIKVDQIDEQGISIACLGARTDRGRGAKKRAKAREEGAMKALPDNDSIAAFLTYSTRPRDFLALREAFAETLAELAAQVIMQYENPVGPDAPKGPSLREDLDL